MIKSLLTFSRTGNCPKERICLCAVVESGVRLIRGALSEQIAIDVHLEVDRPCWIFADETRMHQLLLNLALNARDAMPEGGRLGIKLSRAGEDRDWAGGDHVILAVSDTGCGIDDELRDRVFEPFFTTKQPGSGTGLGLAIVHGIVQELGGDIRIGSHPPRGTTFRLRLPLVSGEPGPGLPAGEAGIAWGQGLNVLLACHDLQMQGILASAIESWGFSLIVADADAALSRLACGACPDLSLTIVDAVTGSPARRKAVVRLCERFPQSHLLLLDRSLIPDEKMAPRVITMPDVFMMSDLAARIREAVQRKEA